MASIEAAIVLQRSLLEDADEIARSLSISRDRVMEMALEDFIRRYQTGQKLTLEAINAAYVDAPDAEDQRLLKGMRRLQQQVLETTE
jgi:predicted transcriptional regulator